MRPRHAAPCDGDIDDDEPTLTATAVNPTADQVTKLDLDFGSAARDGRAVLVLNGWVDWADGSTFLSAMQEHKDLTFPYLQVKDAAESMARVEAVLANEPGPAEVHPVLYSAARESGRRESGHRRQRPGSL